MNNSATRIFHTLRTAGGCIIFCFLLGAPVRAQISFSVFVDPHPVVSGGTIGFTFAGNKFVGSVQGDGLGVLYATDLDGSNVRLFAPTVSIPGGSPFSEHYVASSAGLGGFPSRDIYVGAGNSILHTSNDGTTSDIFVAGLASPVRGILFDLVGTFDHDMLVATYGGQIYRINGSGTPQLLATLGEDAEGMDIAPLGAHFGSFDGQLVVVSEASGLLRAITPTGVVSILNASNPIPDAERISFVPPNLGASGNPIEGLYGANFQPNVLKADGSQFALFRGDAIVITEQLDRRISRVHWNGPSLQITIIGNFPIQAEDGIFLSPAMIGPGCPASPVFPPREDPNWCWPHCEKPLRPKGPR